MEIPPQILPYWYVKYWFTVPYEQILLIKTGVYRLLELESLFLTYPKVA